MLAMKTWTSSSTTTKSWKGNDFWDRLCRVAQGGGSRECRLNTAPGEPNGQVPEGAQPALCRLGKTIS